MIEIKGKYSEARIFTDVVDSASIAQVQELCNQEFTSGSRIRLMPDIHAGKGCTIGTTMTITDKVVPNLVGVDIGCGMETIRIRESRLGVEVAAHYQEAGYRALNRTDDASLQALTARMRAEGREKEIPKELKRLKNLKQTSIPRALAYVSGELFSQYLHDMKIVQQFAMLNRQAMMDEIVKGMKLHVEEQFTTIHNYIDTEAMILRKGAVSAKAGERLLIPINMRDGSLLCVGKGNEDWNCSAPPRCGAADEPGGRKAVLHGVRIQKADGAGLHHLGEQVHPG